LPGGVSQLQAILGRLERNTDVVREDCFDTGGREQSARFRLLS